MDVMHLAQQLSAAMDSQAEALERFAGAETLLRTHVTDPRMAGERPAADGRAATAATVTAPAQPGDRLAAVQHAIEQLRTLSAAVERSDELRDAAFGELRVALGTPADASFREVIAWLPEKARVGVQLSYNGLREAVTKVRGTSDRLSYLMRSMSGTLAALLDELVPERRGALYSETGTRRESGAQSLLVDQQL